MQVQLKVANGNKAGMSIAINKPRFLIGRAEDCHLKPKSGLISRYHCAILSEEGYVAARDLGSKNGVFVNGQRIQTEEELKNGDHLTIGPLEFEVVLSVTLAAEKKMPKVESIEEVVARTVARDKMVPAQPAGKGDAADASDWLLDEEENVDSSAATQTVQAEQLAELGLAPEPKKDEPAAEEPVAEKPKTEAVPVQGAAEVDESIFEVEEIGGGEDFSGDDDDDAELAKLLNFGDDDSTVSSASSETILAQPKKESKPEPKPAVAAANSSSDADAAANMLKNFFQGH